MTLKSASMSTVPAAHFAFVPYVTLVDPVGVTTVEEAANNGTVVT